MKRNQENIEEETATTDRIPGLFPIENQNYRCEYHRILQMANQLGFWIRWCM